MGTTEYNHANIRPRLADCAADFGQEVPNLGLTLRDLYRRTIDLEPLPSHEVIRRLPRPLPSDVAKIDLTEIPASFRLDMNGVVADVTPGDIEKLLALILRLDGAITCMRVLLDTAIAAANTYRPQARDTTTIEAEPLRGSDVVPFTPRADALSAPTSLADRARTGRKATQDEVISQDFTGIDERDNFLFLGHRGMDEFWFYPLERKIPICLSAKDLGNEQCRMLLADILWWEKTFFGDKGMNKTYAVNWLMRRGTDAGVYDPHMIRGRGIWVDDGRYVFHFGNRLLVDGQPMAVHEIKSEFIYPIAAKLPAPADTALTDAEGHRLVDLAKQFRFAETSSYALLCGWIALAPICGALKWRPHIWVTGGVGSGKTTIIEDFIRKLLGDGPLHCQGSSTEAGIRQELGSDARPVIIDESEPNEESDMRRVQSVLTMFRQASSETDAKTLRGGSTGKGQSFHIRSMGCLASVQVGIKQQADRDRTAKLSLKPKRDFENSPEDWRLIKAGLADIKKDKTISSRLLRRIIDLLPITLQNIETFTEVAANRLGTQREGDQYGTLLAGAWSLMNSGRASLAQAEKFVNSFDLAPFVEESEVEDSTRCLNALLGFTLRTDRGKDLSIHELTCAAVGIKPEGVDISESEASALLKRNGMRVMGLKKIAPATESSLLLSNDHRALNKLFAETRWRSGWKDQLLRERDGVSIWKKVVDFGGYKTRAIAIALSRILPDSEWSDDTLPI